MPAAKKPPRSFRKRARRACDLCKVTKVRCNALEGTPCGKCMQRGVKCVVDERNRRRYKLRMYPKVCKAIPEKFRAGSSPECVISIQPLETMSQRLNTSEKPAIFGSGAGPDQGGLLSNWSKASFNPTSYLQTNSPNMLLFHDSPKENFWNTFTNLGTPEPSPSERSDLAASLSGFIKPLPTAFSPASVEYLQIHGVFTLPSIPLQKALLRKFMECVLPCMPVIEWHSFVDIINGGYGSERHISLLLYHAVMFSATTFVEFEHLLEAGYSSRGEIHETFFQKTKLLYESDYESDALTVIQALLLMTYRSETADENETKHWLDVAISMAQAIGLFQTQSGAENSLYCPRIWKRIGWACYMTDCLISLRLRCQPSIKNMDFYHQMLTVDDFEIYKLSVEDHCLFTGCTLVQDIKAQIDLALICISHAQLCVCINEVLEIQGKNGQLHSSIAATKTSINREDNYAYIARAITSDRALTDWMNSLPPSCQYQLLDSGDINDGDSTLFVQRSYLHMIYYTVIAVLHRSQMFPSSNTRVHYAARQITRIASGLHKRRLHNCLSITGVTAILVAMVIHVSETKTSRWLEREEAMEDFQSCMMMMTSLQDVYSEAKAVTGWMFRAVTNVTLDGGSNCDSQDHENFLSGDLTVSPCSCIPMSSSISVPYLN